MALSLVSCNSSYSSEPESMETSYESFEESSSEWRVNTVKRRIIFFHRLIEMLFQRTVLSIITPGDPRPVPQGMAVGYQGLVVPLLGGLWRDSGH